MAAQQNKTAGSDQLANAGTDSKNKHEPELTEDYLADFPVAVRKRVAEKGVNQAELKACKDRIAGVLWQIIEEERLTDSVFSNAGLVLEEMLFQDMFISNYNRKDSGKVTPYPPFGLVVETVTELLEETAREMYGEIGGDPDDPAGHDEPGVQSWLVACGGADTQLRLYTGTSTKFIKDHVKELAQGANYDLQLWSTKLELIELPAEAKTLKEMQRALYPWDGDETNYVLINNYDSLPEPDDGFVDVQIFDSILDIAAVAHLRITEASNKFILCAARMTPQPTPPTKPIVEEQAQ